MNRRHCDNCDRVMLTSGTPRLRRVTLKNGDYAAVETIIIQPITGHRYELCDECRDELVARVELRPVQ